MNIVRNDMRKYIKEFGLLIFISKTIRKITYKNKSRFAWFVNENNEKIIGQYLTKEFEKIDLNMDEFLQFRNVSVPNAPIWVMWWQGVDCAPEIVKCCINSIKKNCNGHEVIVITEKNVNKYITLPGFITEKVNNGGITRTHLSDLIRLNLLYLYGGVWIDATVLVTQPIPNSMFKKEFFTVNFGVRTKDPSHGRWTTFLLFGHKKNVLFRKVLEDHYKYWFKHDILVDYIMFDYIINYVIKHDQRLLEQVITIEQNNKDVFKLRKLINHTADTWNENMLDKDTIFYKLSYKQNLLTEINGKKTIYSKILETYKEQIIWKEEVSG